MNNYNSQPIILDTDLTSGTGSWRTNQTLVAQTSNALAGIRPYKITLVSNSTSGTAGTVNITAIDGTPLYPALYVSAGAAVGYVFYADSPTQLLTWKDFYVSGLTATSSTLYIWYRS